MEGNYAAKLFSKLCGIKRDAAKKMQNENTQNSAACFHAMLQSYYNFCLKCWTKMTPKRDFGPE